MDAQEIDEHTNMKALHRSLTLPFLQGLGDRFIEIAPIVQGFDFEEMD